MINFFKTLWTLSHFHSWEYTPAVFGNELMERLGIPQQNARRVCKKCGAVQIQDIHCLGFNPPKYIKTWRPL